MDELNSQYPGDPMERPENGGEPRPEETADGESRPLKCRMTLRYRSSGVFWPEEKGSRKRTCSGRSAERGEGGREAVYGGVRRGSGRGQGSVRTLLAGRRDGMQERRRREEQEREEALLARLTEEFEALRIQNPSIREPDELPAAVLQTAVGGGYPAVRRLSPV